MQIDWFTFTAQIVNFVILVVALKFLLYDRIVSVMRKRNESISSKFDEAEQKEAEAEQLRQKYEDGLEEIERKRDETLSEAKEKAEQRRSEMLKEARGEIDRKRSRWRRSLREEREDFIRDLKRRLSGEIFETTRAVIADIADSSLEGLAARRFIERIEEMDEKQRDEILGKLDEGDTITVRSSFEIDGDTRSAVKEAVRGRLSDDSRIEFEVTSDILCGIELSWEGGKVSWNAGARLDEIERSAESYLEEQSDRHGEDDEKGGDDE